MAIIEVIYFCDFTRRFIDLWILKEKNKKIVLLIEGKIEIKTVVIFQICALSGVLPREGAIAQIKKSIRKTYGKKGEAKE